MSLFFQAARWMSRRNGQSLAQAVAAQMEQLAGELPHRPALEYWRQALTRRPGWRLAGNDRYEFRTGEHLQLESSLSSKELIRRMTAIEVKPLGQDLPLEAQKVLLSDAVEAAVGWWERHAAHLP